jgi:hypothetical protein
MEAAQSYETLVTFVGLRSLTFQITLPFIVTAVRTSYPTEFATLADGFMLVPFFAYSSTLKMEAACSPETSVDFQRTACLYMPEDRTLHSILYFVQP